MLLPTHTYTMNNHSVWAGLWKRVEQENLKRLESSNCRDGWMEALLAAAATYVVKVACV